MSARAALEDMKTLKNHMSHLQNKHILYKLVEKCFAKPHKLLAFMIIIEHWPFKVFSLGQVGCDVTNAAYVIISNLLRKGRLKNIAQLDLLMQDTSFSERKQNTNAVMQIFKDHSTKNSIEYYKGFSSHSYGEIITTIKKHLNSSSQESNEEIHATKGNEKPTIMKIEIVVDDTNLHFVKGVLAKRSKRQIINIELIIERIAINHLHPYNVISLLKLFSPENVLVMDLSYINLSSWAFQTVASFYEEVCKFKKLTRLITRYNNLNLGSNKYLVNCLASLKNLVYVDISYNLLYTYDTFLRDGISSDCLHTLVLSGCGISPSDIKFFLKNSEKFAYLHTLNICGNCSIAKKIKLFLKFLLIFKENLRKLNISKCGINKAECLATCKILSHYKKLEYLEIYPNGDLSEEDLILDVKPQLKLLDLKSFSPLI